MKRTNFLTRMLLLCALIVGSVSSVWADETITFSSLSLSNGVQYTTINGTDCTLTFGDGGNDGKYYTTGAAIRVYGGGHMTVSSSKTITKIVLTFGSGDGSNNISVDTGSFTSPTWTGSATSVTFTVGGSSGHRRIASVAVTYATSGEVTTVTVDDTGITNTDIASGTAAGFFAATVKDASSKAIVGATVTWSSSNTAVATIDETGAVTLKKKGTTTITANYAGVDGTYQASSNTYDLTVTNSNAGEGTSAKPFKPSEAIDALDTPGTIVVDAEYYVSGIVSKVGTLSDAGELTYFISDDGTTTNQLECYKGLGLDGADFEATTDLEVGDKVTVKGKLTIYGMSTYEFEAGSIITSLVQRTKVNISTFTADATTLVKGETTTTAVTNDVPAWTASYTYESDDETVATVDATGKITAVAKGTANITVTPNIDVDDENYKVGTSKSIEITVNNPSHDVVFLVNGEEYSTASVEEEEAISFPTNPSALGGKAFVGWSTAEVATTNEKPEIVTSANMGDADVTYYAVFATVSGSTTTKTDVLDYSFIGVSGTSYSSWSDKSGSASTAVYAGNSAGGNSAIQLRSSNSSGIISTTSGGKVKKVTVTWNSSTAAERTLDVYGSNGAYTATSDLYSTSTQGTKIDGMKNGTTELTIDGDYTYIGLRSNSGAMYLDEISIEWEVDNRTYSAYTTTVTETTPEVTSAGWATYVAAYDMEFDEGDAFIVTDVNTTSGAVTLTGVTEVSQDAPVLLKGAGAKTAKVLASTSVDLSSNMLSICDGEDNGTKVPYVLAKKDAGAGFLKWTGEIEELNERVVLWLDTEVSSAREFFFLEDETTGVEELKNSRKEELKSFYNLNGQRVAQPSKGLYIVSGRKVVVK